jgi:hypothetical protein
MERIFAGDSDRSEQVPLERRDGSLLEVPVLSIRPVTIDGEVVGAVFECVTSALYHADQIAIASRSRQ